MGPALLVVLDMLDPVERLAFVLHDLFGVPFEEIAPIADRSPAGARQIASRARRRIQGADRLPDADLRRQREIVYAFMATSREGDFDASLAVLDPDVVLRADSVILPAGRPPEIRGARQWPEVLSRTPPVIAWPRGPGQRHRGSHRRAARTSVRGTQLDLQRREDLRDRCDRRSGPPGEPGSGGARRLSRYGPPLAAALRLSVQNAISAVQRSANDLSPNISSSVDGARFRHHR